MEDNKDMTHYEITGPNRIRMADKLGLTREERVAVTRLRTGHSFLLRS